jgi:hypothetical protein
MTSRSLLLSSLALLVALVAACAPPEPASDTGSSSEPAIDTVQATAANASAEVATEAAPEASAAQIPSYTIVATDYAFEVPADIPSGWVSLTLTNEGQANHHGIMMHLRDGVTMDQVEASLADDNADPQLISDAGFFFPDTDSGKSNQVALQMLPGHWAIASVSMADFASPTPDWARGSLAEFTVGEEPSGAAEPEADMTVTIGQDDFDLPESVAAGEHTIKVVNDTGTPNAFAFILELRGDTTMASIMDTFDAVFSGKQPPEPPADFSAVGGLMDNSVSPTYTTTVDLQPGRYVMVTSIGPDDFPYAGLAKEFTVAP